ncbi:protein of unknown function [Rhizobium sp. RU20A]|uniref:DUF4864 domain-containing protein n=1 Tax=Rhizobium sp. RU20A TaxID=1907412 RepID=UPI000956F2E5|nr:DUF4864 domain-containing protein [Rhizobium sp. RU20A]SIQ08542.1 protein of unknown function [Rhizobium sp. RU20A]
MHPSRHSRPLHRARAIAVARPAAHRRLVLLVGTGILLTLFALLCAPRAFAGPVEDGQKIIAAQVQAFLDDDADTAYGFASPAIRTLYPDKDRFFAMVKRGYGPVYRPDNFSFGRSKVDGDSIIQEVLIKGPDGKDWTALYQLLRQPDGSLKINGVQMLTGVAGAPI